MSRGEETRGVKEGGSTGEGVLQAAPPVAMPAAGSPDQKPSPTAQEDVPDACPSPARQPEEEDRRRGRERVAARGVISGNEVGEGPETEAGCGRERLKRHRVAMAGRVWIPETWGQEGLLKDWADCAAIDRALVPSGLGSAREALMEEFRRAEKIVYENNCGFSRVAKSVV